MSFTGRLAASVTILAGNALIVLSLRWIRCVALVSGLHRGVGVGLKLDQGVNPAFGVQPARQNALMEGARAVLSGCHGAFVSPLRGLRLPNRPGLPGVFSALMRQVRAPTSWRCPSKRAPALTSCLDRLLEGVSSVRRYLRHDRMGVFRPSLWFHRSPTGHSPREPRISRAFASAARATAQEVVALAGLASIHPTGC